MSGKLLSKKRYGNFVIHRVTEITEIQSTLVEAEHLPSGAQIMQIANDDDENLFNLSFRTWPDRSNGVAHILEHTVLCGSKKFPVKDPFFSMNRRSLNTFMNALTGADFTCYPAATQVEKDFYNLLEVYLDAVFRPVLTKLSFLQEGHRLEFLNPGDPNSPLLFKGIVYNEMKGAMATGEARLMESLMQSLFPDLTYGFNSGGDPAEILSLTYEELKGFHEKFYHPSRCLYFFYGNLPLEKHLDFLEEHALKGVEKLPPLPLLSKQPRFKRKVEKTLTYPISADEEPENKSLMALAWLTCTILEQEELLALCVLEVVLMGTDAAPLKKALLKSGLCKQADSFLEIEISEIPFAIICKGCSEKSADRLEKIIRETLAQLVEEGLPNHLVEGAIHQLEIARTEIIGNSSPYGLHLYFRSALLKQHGGNPEDGLRVHSLFGTLREKVKDSRYLPNILKKHVLQNPHCVRLMMHPDKGLLKKEIEAEKTKIYEICKTLKDPDIQQILKQSQELTKLQEALETENLNILPKVNLSDVSPESKEFPLYHEKFEQLELFYHPCFTNELIYADLVFDLPDIAEEDLPYLRLFTLLLPQMGCGGRDYQDHLEYLLEYTGGIGVSLDLGLQADNPAQMRPSLSIRGKALYRKMDKFFPLFRDLVISANFKDTTRLKELLVQHFHSLENSLQHSALRYAVNLASRGLSVPSTILSQWYGLDYFWTIKNTLKEFEKNPDLLINKLIQLQTQCLGLEGGNLVLSCDEKIVQKLKNEKFYGLMEIPSRPFAPWKGVYPIQETASQGRITASPVAFTAMLFPSVNYIHPHAAALSVASEIMENLVLHKRIREQGGAYGAGAVNGSLSSQFYLYAYRDPHLSLTLTAFEEAIQTIVKGEFEPTDIEEAQLGLFQDLDSPIPPGVRAITAYGRLRGNRTSAIRHEFRKRLFELSKKEIQKAGKEHLEPGFKEGVLVSFAGKELLEKENKLLQNPLPLHTI